MRNKYLSPAYIRWLFLAYGLIIIGAAVLTFAIYFAIQRPGAGLAFVAGVAIGMMAAAFFLSDFLRERRNRALNYVHQIQTMAHV
jgi:hypothetical protein